MNPRARLRAHAVRDLEALVDFFDQANPLIANRFLDAVWTTLDFLVQHPGAGSPKHLRSRRLSDIRSCSVAGFDDYLIFYRRTDHAILVVAICHGARDIKTILRDRV